MSITNSQKIILVFAIAVITDLLPLLISNENALLEQFGIDTKWAMVVRLVGSFLVAYFTKYKFIDDKQ